MLIAALETLTLPVGLERLTATSSDRVQVDDAGDVEDFPTPFPIRGRDALPIIPEFGAPFPGFTLEEGSHRCLVEILENDQDSWRELLDFELHVTGDKEKRSRYLAYSNLAEDPRAKERAEAAARDLLKKLKRK